MAYFYKMLYEKENMYEEKKEQNMCEEKKMTDEEIFFSHLELKYNIYGKRFVLERNINSILKIISNKPGLYSINKKKTYLSFSL